MSVYNLTPHSVVVVDKKSKTVLKSFEADLSKCLRGYQMLGEARDPVMDCPVFGQGHYAADEEDWDACNLKRGDTVITSTIGATQFKELAQRDGIRLLIPASGPDQCFRNEKGQIQGVYFFLEL